MSDEEVGKYIILFQHDKHWFGDRLERIYKKFFGKSAILIGGMTRGDFLSVDYADTDQPYSAIIFRASELSDELWIQFNFGMSCTYELGSSSVKKSFLETIKPLLRKFDELLNIIEDSS